MPLPLLQHGTKRGVTALLIRHLPAGLADGAHTTGDASLAGRALAQVHAARPLATLDCAASAHLGGGLPLALGTYLMHE